MADRSTWVYGGGTPGFVAEETSTDRCIFCIDASPIISFEFPMWDGARIAVPDWVAICRECVILIKEDDMAGLALRTRGTSWDDFPDSDMFEIARRMSGKVAPVRVRQRGSPED
jgi:hypothetical protein